MIHPVLQGHLADMDNSSQSPKAPRGGQRRCKQYASRRMFRPSWRYLPLPRSPTAVRLISRSLPHPPPPLPLGLWVWAWAWAFPPLDLSSAGKRDEGLITAVISAAPSQEAQSSLTLMLRRSCRFVFVLMMLVPSSSSHPPPPHTHSPHFCFSRRGQHSPPPAGQRKAWNFPFLAVSLGFFLFFFSFLFEAGKMFQAIIKYLCLVSEA